MPPGLNYHHHHQNHQQNSVVCVYVCVYTKMNWIKWMIFWCFRLVVVWFGSKVEFFFWIRIQDSCSMVFFTSFLWVSLGNFFLSSLNFFFLFHWKGFLSFFSLGLRNFSKKKLEFFHLFANHTFLNEKKILCMCFLNNNNNNDTHTRCMFVHLKCKFRFLFWVFFQYFFISGFVKCRWRLRFSDWYDDSIKNSLHEFFVVVLPNNKQTNRKKRKKKR